MANILDSFELSATARIVLVALVVLCVVRWLTKKRHRFPPGPTPLPLIGNILEFRGASMRHKFTEFKEKFGPVFTLHLGLKKVVILNDIDSVNEAYVKLGSDFADRPHLYSMSKMSDGGKNIVFGPYGESWKFQRKLAVQALRQYLTGTQLENRVHEALKPAIEIFKSEKGPVSPQKYISFCVFNVLHGLCFGAPMHWEDPIFHRLIKVLDSGVDVGNGFVEDFIPPLRLWPSKPFREIMEGLDFFKAYTRKQLDQHWADFDSEKLNSLTDNIILAREQAKKQEDPAVAALFTDTHAVMTLNDVFVAGIDTTRSTLDWVVLVLASHPQIQEKVIAEVDNIIGSEIPGKEHRSKLVYTEAVLLETMRLYYVVPIGIPHQTLRDTKIGDYEIPAKTMVIPYNLAIMRDARYWDDPLTFKPERFMDETGTKLMTRHKSWAPFSVGPRSCIGESLAKLELVYIITGLLQEFKFSLPPGVKGDFTPSGEGLTNLPSDYKVFVSRRRG